MSGKQDSQAIGQYVRELARNTGMDPQTATALRHHVIVCSDCRLHALRQIRNREQVDKT